jgi:hypothetical protein
LKEQATVEDRPHDSERTQRNLRCVPPLCNYGRTAGS